VFIGEGGVNEAKKVGDVYVYSFSYEISYIIWKSKYEQLGKCLLRNF